MREVRVIDSFGERNYGEKRKNNTSNNNNNNTDIKKKSSDSLTKIDWFGETTLITNTNVHANSNNQNHDSRASSSRNKVRRKKSLGALYGPKCKRNHSNNNIDKRNGVIDDTNVEEVELEPASKIEITQNNNNNNNVNNNNYNNNDSLSFLSV